MHKIVKRIEKGKEYWDITLTRGDSLFLQVSLTKNDEPYTPETGSSIRFAMKARYTDPDDAVLLNKDISIDSLILAFAPNDTKPLKMNRTYVYDIQLTDEIGRVTTFIEGNFFVDKEVV